MAASRVCRGCRDFSARVAANIAWACATLAFRDLPLLESLCLRDGAGCQDIANAAWASGKLLISDPGLAPHVLRRSAEFQLRELANVARAFATLETSERAVWRVLVQQAVEKITEHTTLGDLESLVAAVASVATPDLLPLSQAAAHVLEQRALHLNGSAVPPPVAVSRELADVPEVLFASDCLAVLWKPPGWSVRVGRDDFGTDRPFVEEGVGRQLQEWLMETFGQTHPIAMDAAVSHGLLHRLDRMTSGLIFWATSYRGYYATRLKLATRRGLRKEYTCLCHGWLPRGPTFIDLPLEEALGLRRSQVAPWGRPSRTKLEQILHLEGPSGWTSLLRVELHSGRQHQIRCHLSALGHPLLGDEVYGGDSSGRPCLHASELRLDDIQVALAWPRDLEPTVEELRPMDLAARIALRALKHLSRSSSLCAEVVATRSWLMWGHGCEIRSWTVLSRPLGQSMTSSTWQVKLPLTAPSTKHDQDRGAEVKYIDPTYMIRAIKPNANDSPLPLGGSSRDLGVYCSMLSHNAVHAAMAGYTAITLGPAPRHAWHAAVEVR